MLSRREGARVRVDLINDSIFEEEVQNFFETNLNVIL